MSRGGREACSRARRMLWQLIGNLLLRLACLLPAAAQQWQRASPARRCMAPYTGTANPCYIRSCTMRWEHHNLNSPLSGNIHRAARRFGRWPRLTWQLCLLVAGLSFIGIACRQAGNSTTEPLPTPGGVDQPLTSFQQNLTSSTTKLDLHPGQDIKLPVRIENPGAEPWVSAGSFPVTVSYKWFKGAEMLPIEGERTMLPARLGPKQAASVDVRVVAPNQPGEFSLRVTLVQEGVAWFMGKSNQFLEVPTSVR